MRIARWRRHFGRRLRRRLRGGRLHFRFAPLRRIDLGPAGGPPNRPPVLDPLGMDGATLLATSPAGARVGLYANAVDPDGDLLTYTWTGPFGSRTGFGMAVRLPIGVSTVTVDVDDGHGHVVHLGEREDADLQFLMRIPTHRRVHDAIFDEHEMHGVCLQRGIGRGPAQRARRAAGMAGFFQQFALPRRQRIFAGVNHSARRLP